MSAVVTKDQPSVAKLLEAQKAQIATALPKHMTADRMARIALTELRKNPELLICEPLSFLGAIIQCAQLGLEPGNALGHAYLVPFWNSKKKRKEVQLIPGYRGFIDLARRSGEILTISARTVHENDSFDYSYGLDETLNHRPSLGERGDVIGAYAVAKLKDGGHQFEFMSREQIDKIKSDTTVWKNHYEEMARKTVVRRLAKYLPLSVELASLIEISDKEETSVTQDNGQILIDAGVEEPEPVATSAVQVADEAIKPKGDIIKDKLLDAIENRINALNETGVTEEQVYDFLKVKSFDDVAKWPTKKLQTALELLQSFKVKG